MISVNPASGALELVEGSCELGGFARVVDAGVVVAYEIVPGSDELASEVEEAAFGPFGGFLLLSVPFLEGSLILAGELADGGALGTGGIGLGADDGRKCNAQNDTDCVMHGCFEEYGRETRLLQARVARAASS